MEALIVIDMQNEFSPEGKRSVANFPGAVEAIQNRVNQAREEARPIAWIRHHNRPNESSAFKPGSWGAKFIPGFGPRPGHNNEVEFEKNVYGAFTGTPIESWLTQVGASAIMVVGFYTHGCVSTTVREAIMRGLAVSIDPKATGTCDITHVILGRQTADEVRRSALLQLAQMGAHIAPLNGGRQ